MAVVVTSPSKVQSVTLARYHSIRNRILILRAVGGLGDILMHRMLFEDIKSLVPDATLHFACPAQYHDAVRDHPFLDAVLDSRSVDTKDYGVFYNTSTVCGRYEISIAPRSDLHRSDIWAAHCGFRLTRHDMHFRLSDEEVGWARRTLRGIGGGKPVAIVSPISAMQNKDLRNRQQEAVIRALDSRGVIPVGLHTIPLPHFDKIGIPHLYGLDLRKWMAVIHESDMVVSVDSAAFHCAGGMGKPLMGVFSFADGKVYGKYFEFTLVQKHRDDEPWCGPCYNWCRCVKTQTNPKPCITEIDADILSAGVDRLLEAYERRVDVASDRAE